MKNYITGKSVYEASNERIEYIFENFNKIYVSFSGGKDSGVMLNLMLDYMRKNNITKKIGVMILDNEANYNLSLEFMHRILEANLDLLDVYWCCLPITLPCTVSSYATEWQCWGVNDEKRWISPMPKQSYVVNMKNKPFDFFEENMSYDEFWDKFGEWYSQGERCACLIGIRCDESLNRFRAIMNDRKEMLGVLDFVEDCSYYHYCLQLSIYKELLKDIDIRKMFIIHITTDDYFFIECENILEKIKLEQLI